MSDKPETPIQLPEKPADEARPSDSIVISQATIYYFVIAILFFVAGFGVAWILFSTTTGSTVASIKADVVNAAQSAVASAVANMPAGNAVAAAATETPIPPQNVSPGQNIAWGPADAKVTIVEFSDFQCPFCERFFKLTYPLIKQKYGDKVRFVYRNFPLTQIHPQAEQSALAAECANEQGKFWDYHDELFSNQQDLSRDALIKYAQNAKVSNISQFTTCFDSKKYQDQVNKDLNDGLGYYVNGTPTFFINGKILVGAQPYEVFEKAIDQELSSAGGR
jgi:protein-disulfide isomerase